MSDKAYDKLFDKLFDDEQEMAYFFKTEGNDTKANRDAVLRTPQLCYMYCHLVSDIEEVWTRITDEEWIHWYCKFVCDRPEMFARLKTRRWISSIENWRKWRKEPYV